MNEKRFEVPSLQGLVNGSDVSLDERSLEVFELPYKEALVLGFRIQRQIIGVRVDGEFSPELMHRLLSTWVFRLLTDVLLGRPLQDTPFSKARIKTHPKRLMSPPDGSFELENSFIQEALAQSLPLMLARMQSLPWRALIEAIISVVLDLEENEIITIEGSRAEIWNAHTEEMANKLLTEMSVKTVVRTRRWNKAMRRKALRLFEDTIAVLKELKRTYFGSQSARIRRRNPNLKPWKDVKADYPQLEAILNKLPGRKPRELAISHVGDCLGSASESYTYRQIKIARAERREREKAQNLPSRGSAIIGHAVHTVAKKWDAEHRILMSTKTPS